MSSSFKKDQIKILKEINRINLTLIDMENEYRRLIERKKYLLKLGIK